MRKALVAVEQDGTGTPCLINVGVSLLALGHQIRWLVFCEFYGM